MAPQLLLAIGIKKCSLKNEPTKSWNTSAKANNTHGNIFDINQNVAIFFPSLKNGFIKLFILFQQLFFKSYSSTEDSISGVIIVDSAGGSIVKSSLAVIVSALHLSKTRV